MTVEDWLNELLDSPSTIYGFPILKHIETKAPDKSWTDGKPQLGIWTAALLARLRRIPRKTNTALHHPPPENESYFETIAIPLVIAQGHN